MESSGLILPGEESDANGVVTRWEISRAVKHDGTCFLVMDVCIEAYGARECGEVNTVEILVLSANGQPQLFEKAFPGSTKPIRVAIGGISKGTHDDGTPADMGSDFYYMELKGDSALAARKSILSHTNFCGFSADLPAPDKASKLSFDPTPGRTWKVLRPEYSLRRGMTPEIHDVRAGHLDDDYKAYYEGSNGKVAPWGACFIRQYYDASSKKWIEVVKK